MEHDGAGGFSLELACCQSRVFGKLGPNAPGHFTPTAPDSLNDHGDERDALGQAFRTRFLVAGFEILVPTGDTVRIGSISVQAQAEATGDREIPSGRRAKPPPRDVHVSRTPRPWPGVMLVEDAAVLVSGTQQRPLREQARFLQLRPMIGRLGSVTMDCPWISMIIHGHPWISMGGEPVDHVGGTGQHIPGEPLGRETLTHFLYRK